jgi:hypothetical protein
MATIYGQHKTINTADGGEPYSMVMGKYKQKVVKRLNSTQKSSQILNLLPFIMLFSRFWLLQNPRHM